MNTTMLYTFVVAASTGSIPETAKKLRYGKSTVLYHIREVEKVCGSELFDREVRGFNLTRSGRKAFEISEKLLRMTDELKSLPSVESQRVTRLRQHSVHSSSPRSLRPSG